MVMNSVTAGEPPAYTARPVSAPPNKTLEGHKLMILAHSDPSPEYLERLRRKFPGLKIVSHSVEWASTAWPAELPDEEWDGVTILLGSGNVFPSPDQVPKLEYVQLQSAGANHIVNDPLYARADIAFCTANGVHGPQISEWVICTFLAFQHQIPKYLDYQREKIWRRDGDLPEDAVGLRVGILGYGSIGRQVARVAKAMGCDVHAYTLHARDTPESRRDDGYTPAGLGDPEGVLPSRWFSGAGKADLHAFLGSGLDLLVVAVPLTAGSRHLLAAEEFEVLAPRRTFVSNVARGPVVHTADLIAALDKGLVRGAALDVTDPEPLPDGHELWGAKNVIITPHVSGASKSYVKRVLEILELNLDRLSEGRELVNKVNRKEGY